MKVGAHHSDNRVRSVVERDGPANNIWIAAEATLPQTIAENDNEVFSILLFFRCKYSSEHGRALHNLEETITNLNRRNSFSLAITRHDRVPTCIRRYVFKDSILAAEVRHIGSGNLVTAFEVVLSLCITPNKH